jgi:MoxR-like ATPase
MSSFPVYEPGADVAKNRARYDEVRLPDELARHESTAASYEPSQDLIEAVNTAILVGRPLLVTGRPGTGKTSLAYHLAHKLGLPLHDYTVRSDATADDLLYRFDHVEHFKAERRSGEPLSKDSFVELGVLGSVLDSKEPAVVLIDEIDKAPRDFPNDLLAALDVHRFRIRETRKVIEGDPTRPPIVVITSNSEQRLPAPFLRRCVVHHIRLKPSDVENIVTRRGQWPGLDAGVRDAALRRFLSLMDDPELRKPPSPGELLVWLAALRARNWTDIGAIRGPFEDLPAKGCLIKDPDDLQLLGSRGGG